METTNLPDQVAFDRGSESLALVRDCLAKGLENERSMEDWIPNRILLLEEILELIDGV